MSTNTGPRSAARYINQFSQQYFLLHRSSVDKYLAVDLKDPGSIPGRGEIYFKEEMNQKVKNNMNNSSNSLVFGRLPQTKSS